MESVIPKCENAKHRRKHKKHEKNRIKKLKKKQQSIDEEARKVNFCLNSSSIVAKPVEAISIDEDKTEGMIFFLFKKTLLYENKLKSFLVNANLFVFYYI